ncbi:ricin-type beta-trefoil lectin domain protein [Micromonospora sp. NPDC049044]|uniref:ricin-type beta-trefoil lectin domain protein n=1 Tax=unclassified Micromonospora TaxID=2617518 RepID=UPI0033DB02A6
MGPRPQRRLHHPVLATLALVLTTGLWAAPASAAPAQEPGVTLRVFDVQVPLSELCTLKPAQTPNVDKLMSTINWTSAADFGFEDNFVSQVLGNITTTQAGSYTFRLSSDDGSKLAIDNTVVINHDGLHGATPPKEGSVTLTAGLHPLRIDHFERGGGQQITLEWKTPGSASFVVVPNSALSTDAGVVRVTAPGRKECEGIADTPGDGLPLTGVHPGYTLTNLRPNGFQPKVTGMDWLTDGRLVISTWGGSDQSGTSQDGEVWILGNTGGATTPGAVTTKRIASGLKEPQGLKVVDGVVYVSEKQRLTRLVNTGGDEVAERLETVATWPYGGNFHEFAFGLLYQDGFFYLNLSVSINSGGATTNPQPAANRGTTLKVNKDTGAVSYVAGGLRTPHGIGWGPEGGIFVTDNQGGWLPSSKLLHVKQGRFFNHYTNPAGPFDTAQVTQPVLWMPQNEIANSPSTPLYLTSGRYAGQFVIGDVTYGGLQRANVEKINGEYQGALFRLTQGLEAGVSEVNIGPDGAIYVGGLGAGGNWGQTGKLSYGLQKLTPTSTTAFEMLAMRATTTGFEVEYTQPVSTETAADLAARYKVRQWRYVATSNYGGPKIDEETLTVTSATLSSDGRKVSLTVPGRKAGRVVHLRSPRPFTSTSGQSLWSTEAWYTLNSIPGSPPPPTGGTITGAGGKCLDVDNSGLADGTKIQLYTCNGTAAQSWTRLDDTYRVLGKCLDVDNGGTANGTKVQLWTCNGTGAQSWQPQSDGSIRNPQSGKVLEAAGGSTANGTQIQLGTYAGGAHQKWVIGSGVTG